MRCAYCALQSLQSRSWPLSGLFCCGLYRLALSQGPEAFLPRWPAWALLIREMQPCLRHAKQKSTRLPAVDLIGQVQTLVRPLTILFFLGHQLTPHHGILPTRRHGDCSSVGKQTHACSAPSFPSVAVRARPRAPTTAQSKSAVADLDHYYEWPNPRYSEVRLRAVPL